MRSTELNIQTLQYLTQTLREVLLTYLAFSYITRYRLANIERRFKVEQSKITLAGDIDSLKISCNSLLFDAARHPKNINFVL